MNETQIVERLASIETKIDTFIKITDDQETRIRRLEKVTTLAAGAVTIMGGMLAWVVNSINVRIM